MDVLHIAPVHFAPASSGLCITHMSRCVRADCKRSSWRGLPIRVKVSSPPPAGAGHDRWCAGMNLLQHNRLHAGIACMPDRLDARTSTSSIPETRMRNNGPRAGSRVRLLRQRGCRTPHIATRVTPPETRIHPGVCSGNDVCCFCDHSWRDQVMSLIHRIPWMVR